MNRWLSLHTKLILIFRFCHNFGFWLLSTFDFLFCHHLTFMIFFSQFEVLCILEIFTLDVLDFFVNLCSYFLTIFNLQVFHSLIFEVLSQFDFLSFEPFLVLSFFKIWFFELSQNLIFSILVTILVFKFFQNLSFWVGR